MKKYYDLNGNRVALYTDVYAYTENTSIYAVCDDGEPYGNLTVNLCELESADLAYLNVNLFGATVEKFFTENGFGERIDGRERKSGYVTYPLYKLNLARINS